MSFRSRGSRFLRPLGLAIGALLCLTVVNLAVHARTGRVPLERIAIDSGVRVAVRSVSNGTLIAERVERLAAPEHAEISGSLQSIDADAGSLKLLGYDVRIGPDVTILREFPNSAGGDRSLVVARLDDLQPGLGVRVRVASTADDVRVADRIDILSGQSGSRGTIVGLVQQIERPSRQSVSILVSGVKLLINGGTEFSGFDRTPHYIVRPRLGAVDDDDLQFRGSRIRRHLEIAGELRVGFEHATGSELQAATNESDRDVSTGARGLLGLAAEFGPVFAYVEAGGSQEYEIDESNELVNDGGRARLREAYLEFFAGEHVSVAVGRQKFKERRRWYYDRSELDALRVLLDFMPLTIEGSVSQSAADEPVEWRNYIGRIGVNIARRHRTELYYVDRVNRTVAEDSPTYYGLRFTGEVKRRLDYWADLVSQRGSRALVDDAGQAVEVRDIRAVAFDVGLTFQPRVKAAPSVTLGYAFGSGDDTGCCMGEPDGRFTQTGLHRNRGRFHGNSSFRYYGEALDPELSNLHVWTAGIGIRPVRSFSLDAIYHTYRQDVAAASVYGTDLEADPLGVSDDIGSEWDFVLGYEPRQWFELRLTAGRFVPGRAFEDPVGSFDVLRFETRFRF